MDQVSAQHILVEDESTAQELLDKINAEESFEDLAKAHSECPSGKDGGKLGSFGKGAMVPEFEEAAFALAVGEISGPVKTQFGYHLIKRSDY